MEESWPRSPVQTERSEVCASNRGQDSPIQTDLQARLIRCLLYGQTIKQRNKNINSFVCFPARDQVFSWIWQSKADKSNCSKSSFVQTSSINEDKIFHTSSMKKPPQKTLMLNVQLYLCAPGNIAWGLICWTEDILLCCSGGTSSDWGDAPGSRFRIVDISRCRFRWMVVVEAFRIFMTA